MLKITSKFAEKNYFFMWVVLLTSLDCLGAWWGGGHGLLNNNVFWLPRFLLILNIFSANLLFLSALFYLVYLRVPSPVVSLIFSVSMVFWLFGWQVFRATGVFPGRETLFFFFEMMGPGHVTEHALSQDTSLVLWAALSCATLLGFAFWKAPLLIISIRENITLRQIVFGSLSALILLLFSIGTVNFLDRTGRDFFHAPSRQFISYENYLAHQMAYGSTPFGVYLAQLLPYQGSRRIFSEKQLKIWSEEALRKGHLKILYPERTTALDYAATVSKPPRKNVILILVESMRNDVLMAFGGRQKAMPNLEILAQKSMKFQSSYAQAAYSALADPATMIGHYPLRSKDQEPYPKNIPYPREAIFDLLQELGYKVSVFSSQNESWGGMAHLLYNGKPRGREITIHHAGNNKEENYLPEHDGTRVSDWLRLEGEFSQRIGRAGKVDDAVTIRKLILWIEENRRKEPERPYFSYVNLQSSHFPYWKPNNWKPLFIEGEKNYPMLFGKFPKEKVSDVYNRYLNSLNYLDAQLGMLFSYLQSRKEFEETIVIVAGDNGEAFYEHGVSGHGGALYEEMIRTPLIIWSPNGIPADIHVPTEQIDIPPTILSLLGLPSFDGFQGYDLLGVMPEDRLRFIYTDGPFVAQQVVVHRGWKLIEDLRWRRYELYNLNADPGERNDLSRKEPQRLKELATYLYLWRDRQLAYYQDLDLHTRSFPPQLRIGDARVQKAPQ